MIHEYMSSWKELITLSYIQSVKYAFGYSYCIILLRSYNYDTQAAMIQIKKTM